MYLPAQFAEHDAARLRAAMRDHPFATLVSEGPEGAVADHLPLLVTENGNDMLLRGHVARANPLWHAHPPARKVLAIFHGPQHYVSPTWYPTKREHGKVVPTWNYLAIHARGTLRAIEDADWLMSLLRDLTDSHEAGFAQPWRVDDAPRDYLQKMLAAIVGIEIRVSRLDGKAKFSQNQPAENRAGVVAGLRALGTERASDTADWVERLSAKADAR